MTSPMRNGEVEDRAAGVTSHLRTIARPLARAARNLRLSARVLSISIRRPSTDVVRVFYGHGRIPSPDEIASGGMVKVQELEAAFPNRPSRYNVLYLVSSWLPHGAVKLANAAQRAGAKLVLNQNGVGYAAWFGPDWEAWNAPRAELLARADHVFYQSRFCRESADRFLGQPAGSSEVLFNAVDTSRFVPGVPRRETGAAKIVMVGSHERRYRIDVAIQVLAELRRRKESVELHVHGRLRWCRSENESRADAVRLAVESGVADHMHMHGPYAQRDVAALLVAGDILLHTQYNDACPTAVIEAMACGLPIVYSATGGVPELVGADAGVGVPSELSWEREVPPDPEQLADAVQKVAADRGRYAEAARTRAVERYDLQPWLRRHRELFEVLVR